MTKRCDTCGEFKPPEAFAIRFLATGERLEMCRACKSAYNKLWYARNRDKQKAAVKRNNKRYKARIRALVQAAKDRPCMDCGGRFPAVCMDFDHVRGEKLWSIARAQKRTVEAVTAEMEKCDVVCANCHRLRHEASKRPDAGFGPHSIEEAA